METKTLTLSSVGQITIPRSIRKLLNLESGAKLDLKVNPEDNTITLCKQKTAKEIIKEIKEINKEYSTPKPDPRFKNMSVGEMSLELAKDIKGDTWV